MKKLLALLLLLAAPASAQYTYPLQPQSGFTGGTTTSPILGADGCTPPAYSFTGLPTDGMCTATGSLNLFGSDSVIVSVDHQGFDTGVVYSRLEMSSDVAASAITAQVARSTGSSAAVTVQATDAAVAAEMNASAGGFTNAFTLGHPAVASASALFGEGTLLLGNNGLTTLSFEGSTLGDGFQTTVAVVDPTADRTMTIPNVASGNFLLSTLATATVPFLGPNGSASVPTYSFSGDTDTGIFSSGANALDLSTGGTSRFTLSTTSLATTLPFLSAAGTAAAPAYSFSGDPNTGAYTSAADEFAISAGGVAKVIVTATTFQEASGSAVASAATIAATGNVFHVTGTTTITSVTIKPAGTFITIIFDSGSLTFADGSNLRLAGDFGTTGANDTISLVSDGTNWFETSRSSN